MPVSGTRERVTKLAIATVFGSSLLVDVKPIQAGAPPNRMMCTKVTAAVSAASLVSDERVMARGAGE